jgi:hypothetical protein
MVETDFLYWMVFVVRTPGNPPSLPPPFNLTHTIPPY